MSYLVQLKLKALFAVAGSVCFLYHFEVIHGHTNRNKTSERSTALQS